MSALVRAVMAAQRATAVATVDVQENALAPRWQPPGARVRKWLYRLGRQAQSEARAEEGRDTKYPTEGR